MTIRVFKGKPPILPYPGYSYLNYLGKMSIDDHMRTSLCVNALQMAFWRRKPDPGLLHHSDRGSQYASKE